LFIVIAKQTFIGNLTLLNLTGKSLGYNGIFGKNIFYPLTHPVQISALMIFFVREVT
jgi:hypothetical protein